MYNWVVLNSSYSRILKRHLNNRQNKDASEHNRTIRPQVHIQEKQCVAELVVHRV